MLREIELPPVWLAGAIVIGWGVSRLWTVSFFGGQQIGMMLFAIGAVFMVLAAGQMLLRRTTVIPRRDPNALVTSGCFAISRNPIYVADALMLAGALLYLEAAYMLWLVPLFMAIITRRFVLGEEDRLRRRFGAVYEDYCRATRRWL
ncbi:isoprenylcysteine carboxylmethyltransferase family protein [Thioclava sp. A2]|uniref:methyltransferase family protein n=1 Tax=Thioclava sp. FCG-A2 TaxID=3080562 RepID=UPI0029548B6A|nr:isoprenylcysteine carboxylmethyltransferase family protein [Thioclava sp. A2]MDV7269419.1 isoprenylcysteine carboxylmethyltransferase family protein [Thioclava sp. A2]